MGERNERSGSTREREKPNDNPKPPKANGTSQALNGCACQGVGPAQSVSDGFHAATVPDSDRTARVAKGVRRTSNGIVGLALPRTFIARVGRDTHGWHALQRRFWVRPVSARYGEALFQRV